jgi:hypothetical protein
MRTARHLVAIALFTGAAAAVPLRAHAQVTPDSVVEQQRKVLLEMRKQLQEQVRSINALLSTLPPAPERPRERPAMVECPWPQPMQVAPEVPAPANARRVIPDCFPPDWKPPTELRPYTPQPLATDRPKPIVDDYLGYVIKPPPPELVARFTLDTTYYKKHADANGYPILASAKVPDAALAIVRDQVNYLLAHRPDVRDTMIARGARIVIMAETEYTMDIPEQRNWTVPKYLDPRLTEGERRSYYEPTGLASRSPEGYWNGRARGMGGTLTSCAEENVLGYYRTRYWGSNICVHEFAHGIMGAGIGYADPDWFQEIVDSYKVAKACSLRTAQGYGGNTFNEYWATGLEWYVGNGGRNRADLKAEDPRLYELISRLIPEDKELPVRANVARQNSRDMEEYVRTRNPDWWQRETERQAAAAAAAAQRNANANANARPTGNAAGNRANANTPAPASPPAAPVPSAAECRPTLR